MYLPFPEGKGTIGGYITLEVRDADQLISTQTTSAITVELWCICVDSAINPRLLSQEEEAEVDPMWALHLDEDVTVSNLVLTGRLPCFPEATGEFMMCSHTNIILISPTILGSPNIQDITGCR